jgi:hypothetical protein
MKNVKLCVARPKKSYTQEQLAIMKKYADSQIGRPYSIKGYLRSQPVEGTFCSEYLAEMLNQAHVTNIKPVTLSPANLWRSLYMDFNFTEIRSKK